MNQGIFYYSRIEIESVMCPQSSSRGCNTSASVTVTLTVIQQQNSDRLWHTWIL